MAKLTNKQKAFIEEYMIDLNATQAAIRAGYKEKAAYMTGAENLRKPQIQEELQRRMREREIRTEITQDKVLKELAKIGFADIKDYLSFRTAKTVVARDKETGEPIIDYAQIIEVVDSSEVDGSMIQEVSLSSKGVFSFKLHDKMSALDKIGKHLGMFIDKVESTNVNLNKDVSDMSDEELDAELNKFVSR